MILFLNYFPYLILAFGLYLCFFFAKKHKGTALVGIRIIHTIIGTIMAWVLWLGVSTAYIPKGTVPRIPVPDHTVDPANEPKVENRLLNTTKPPEQTQKAFDEMVDWRAAKAAREKAKSENQELPLPQK